MVLLITGAITPGKDIPDTKLMNVAERKAQYLDALKKNIIELSKVSYLLDGIVYADNSMPDKQLFDECKRLAKDNNIELEILSFSGNQEMLKKCGKGYGEGEITKYAMENSRLILNAKFFFKLTGRISIDNLADIIKRSDAKRCYFNMPNRTLKNMCDTRFYAMPVDLYKAQFIDAYEKVDDNNGHYLEHCMTDVINENNIKTWNFPLYPKYSGISGSKGHVYTYNKYKCVIKDLLSKFGYYKVQITK